MFASNVCAGLAGARADGHELTVCDLTQSDSPRGGGGIST